MITALVICGYILIGVVVYCYFLRKKIKAYMFALKRLNYSERMQTAELAASGLDEGDYVYCITGAMLWPIMLPTDLLGTALYALHAHVLMPVVCKSLEGKLEQNDENSEAHNAEQDAN